ncbi:MAG: type II toxin-antitoxin system RelE/ParE family toxin [Pseudomonadota bacterium]
MASFEIRWKRSAAKELKKLPKSAIERIMSAAETLMNDPVPAASVKLSGAEHTYRIRVGNYRIIYNVLNRILTIEVIRVGHRRDVYRKLP